MGALTIFLAFLEGFALIVSPCILPILPIMLSASLTGDRSKPYGIIVGFIFTFTIFTLFSRTIIQSLHLSPDTLRNFSFAILILLAVVMFSNTLSEKFNLLTNRLTNIGSKSQTNSNGFLSGILFGALVGIIWTPCAGPILAAIIVQVVLQKTTAASIATVIAFAFGAGLPMLFIALLGRRVMTKFNFFRQHSLLVRRILSVIILLSVMIMVFIPIDEFTTNTSSSFQQKNALVDGIATPFPAPEFADISSWINSAPLAMAKLKGKVILIDFWTYSCINCIRTLPYLKDWYAKYHDLGFEIVGVHSPEFQFEHNLTNVQKAVERMGIHYPVALDNNFATWQNYQNQYWPAHYLIDKNGNVVYEHFGEGDYDVTENNIRYLLNLKPETKANESIIRSSAITPETYFGYARAERFVSPESVMDNQPARYSYPTRLESNEWALNGTWIIASDKIIAQSNGASIKLNFIAKNVYAVMSAPSPISITVKFNEQLVTNVSVNDAKLYSLLNFDKTTTGVLEVIAEPGVSLYTFTFG